MNLNVSYNWLKDYFKSNLAVDKFAREFSLKSQTIDRVDSSEPKFKGVVTAKILEVNPHPKADRLQLATVSDGKDTQVVVCGAPNIAVNQVVPLAKVGAIVVDSKVDSGVFQIEKAVIRDVESNGMLCSPKELGLGDDHSGIMILSSDTPLGKKLEDVLNLNDAVMDIEVTSNRADAMSVIGLAREANAVFGLKDNIKEPKPNLKVENKIDLKVEVKDKKLCPRYMAVVMTDFEVKPSPTWLQMRLVSAGLRPINNLVDITNYIAFEYGQPLHVFDYDKLEGKKIVVRKAKDGESIKALDENTYELSKGNLVIADAKNPIAVAGVMGGSESATYDQTKTLVFESANFNPVSIRRTSRGLNLYSDSSSRFEKGLHPENARLAILRAIELAAEISGAKVASEIYDVYEGKPAKPAQIKLEIDKVERHLGVSIAPKKVKEILESLGFKVSGNKNFKVAVPWWRTNDVVMEYDLIEEIARMYGYDKLPEVLPGGALPKQDRNKELDWEIKAKDILSFLGFSEVYNYSFVSSELLSRVGFSVKKAVQIHNPLNEDMQYMRTSLVPQILNNVASNLSHFSNFKIFELSNIYKANQDDLPDELPMLAGAIVSKDKNSFYEAKGSIELMLKKLGIVNYEFKVPDFQSLMWEKNNYLDVVSEGKLLGQFGIINKNILEKFDIDVPVTIFDFDFVEITKHAKTTKSFAGIAEFPSVTRDITAVFDETLNWSNIQSSIVAIDPLIVDCNYLDVYVGKNVGEGKKALSFRVTFRSNEKTLQTSEVDEIMNKVAGVVTQNLKATIK